MAEWRERVQQVQVGDRVAYSRGFLQSIGALTGEMPHARGEVKALKNLGTSVTLAEIAWDGASADLPEKVNVKNLVREQDLHREL